MDNQGDLIAARATPDSVSAIAVVRLSGRGALKTVEAAMNLQPGRLAGMRRAVGNFAGIDSLVALSWPQGRSYTGEEMVDLMCHGTPGTPESVIRKLIDSGARPAEPGEFTRRAWLNGRLTSMDVISLSARFRNISTGETGALQEKLENLLTEIEALIEFGEEHETTDIDRIGELLKEASKAASELRDSIERIEILPRTYIMGPVNSGKSTLFNLLCGEKAAVVSSSPGTTRDGAERTVTIRGRRIRILDSAGTGGEDIDGEALKISIDGMRRGDRIIWMDPIQQDPPAEIVKNHIVIRAASISDMNSYPLKEQWTRLSSFTGQGLEELKDFIAAPEGGSPSWILGEALESIGLADEMCRVSDMALASEIIAQIIRDLHGDIKNSDAVERALEFFCVGK